VISIPLAIDQGSIVRSNSLQSASEPPALAKTGGIVLAPLEHAPLRVMIVDDNVDASDSLGILLRMVGFSIRIHHGGMTAIQEVEEFQPEACVLDVNMPEIDGCELARRLRATQNGNHMLLIAVTALSTRDAYSRTTAAGFDRHIVKPADPQQLLDLLFEFERERRHVPAASAQPPTES
jgi:two-component system OmpR family response regulator